MLVYKIIDIFDLNPTVEGCAENQKFFFLSFWFAPACDQINGILHSRRHATTKPPMQSIVFEESYRTVVSCVFKYLYYSTNDVQFDSLNDVYTTIKRIQLYI